MVLGPHGLVGVLVLLPVVVVVRTGQGVVLIPHHSMVVLTVPVLDGNNKHVTLNYMTRLNHTSFVSILKVRTTRYDITEILLKLALNTNQSINQS
jgi:hypothetical protein